MSEITNLIEAVVAPFTTKKRRPYMEWFYVLNQNGEYLRGDHNREVIANKFKAKYECWLLSYSPNYSTTPDEVILDYIFVLNDDQGEFVGVCQIPANKYTSVVVISYSTRFETVEEFHNFHKAITGLVEYKKIS